MVAGPGLGRVITDGFYRSNYAQGIAGAVVVAVVALVLELIAAGVQRATSRRRSSPNRHPQESAGTPMLAEATEHGS
jgi:osmoprotectant transport system permease protein